MKAFLLVVEIVAVLSALLFGVLWLQNPAGPFEPVTFLVLLVGVTTVDIIRRFLPQRAKDPAEMLGPHRTTDSSIPASSNAVPPDGLQVQGGSIDLNAVDNREIRVTYPAAYEARPNLEIRVDSTLGNKVVVIAEDPTGFTVARPGFWSGPSKDTVHWKATGRLAHH